VWFAWFVQYNTVCLLQGLRVITVGKERSKQSLVDLFFFFFFFLNHMFIVSTVQEMTCIFNDMAKTKLKIKLTINKGNKYKQFSQREQ